MLLHDMRTYMYMTLYMYAQTCSMKVIVAWHDMTMQPLQFAWVPINKVVQIMLAEVSAENADLEEAALFGRDDRKNIRDQL